MKIRAVIAVVILTCCAPVCLHAEENKAINKSPFSFMQGFFLGDEYVEYQSKLSGIEEQYREGKISKEKYDEMRSDAEAEYKQACP